MKHKLIKTIDGKEHELFTSSEEEAKALQAKDSRFEYIGPEDDEPSEGGNEKASKRGKGAGNKNKANENPVTPEVIAPTEEDSPEDDEPSEGGNEN